MGSAAGAGRGWIALNRARASRANPLFDCTTPRGALDMPMAPTAGLGAQVGVTLRPLAPTGARRSAVFRGLPGVSASGIHGIAELAWRGGRYRPRRMR